MSDEDKGKGAPITVEVPVIEEPTPEIKPTRAELEEQGLSPQEIDAAEKQGRVWKEGDPTAEDDKGGKKEPTPPNLDDKNKGGDDKDKGGDKKNLVNELEFDPEKDDSRTKDFNKNEKGLYWNSIKDRKKRQAAESERDRIAIAAKAEKERADRLEQELEEARANPPAKEHQDPIFDEDGNEIKPPEDKDKKKFLTEEDLKKREEEAAAKAEEQKGKDKAKRDAVAAALDAQEADARTRHEDFDSHFDFTNDILNHARAGKLEELFPKAVERLGVESLIKSFVVLAGRADEVKEGSKTAADVSVELGKLHPKYGDGTTPLKPSGDNNGKPKGDPDKLRRSLESSNRRSSANLTGGPSRRAVSLDELTAEDVHALPQTEYNKLRREHPEVIERILHS